ncbi:MAG: Uma2 family endonuclease [Bryobacteraceae bacterium]|jgi:Uma2 family endonuclease
MTVTEEQYLVIDRAAEFRHELLDGEIVALPGGNIRHARLSANILGQLYMALQGSRCEAFASDFRVRVSARVYAYPDVTVVCGSPVLADERQDILLNPTVIVEVLSPSTEHYDRGVKLRYYRAIESLRDYILLAQDQIRIEQYTRGEANTWTLRDYQDASEILLIESIGVSLPIARLYERVEFLPE